MDIKHIYINGERVTPHGTETADMYNPVTGSIIGQVRLGDAIDAERAIAAAKRAFPAFSRTKPAQRIQWLHCLAEAVERHSDALVEAIVEEFGAPLALARWMAWHPASVFRDAAQTLERYEFSYHIGSAKITMEPLGVAGLITPWNSNASFICSKLAMAIASGSTAVVKPSEMSALQTRVVIDALEEADLPAGVWNIVNGRGDVVGAAIATSPHVAKVSFTGSTATGRALLCAGAESFKRFTLELGGKSPVVVLDDADFARSVPFALQVGLMNSGQACIAGTRVLVPQTRLAEFEEGVLEGIHHMRPGDPRDPETTMGPVASRRQWDRVQGYIKKGIQEGAALITGGLGLPEGIDSGWFVRPTVFSRVRNDMVIAREEIFGPVLSIIPYSDDEEAIAIANDTDYGLHAYVAGTDLRRAHRVSDRLVAGRVVINGAEMEPQAPFGGFKHSGIGREHGKFGLEAFLEPKAVAG